jgi:hypothetical protein
VARPPSLPLRDDPTRFDTMTNRPIQASIRSNSGYRQLFRLYHITVLTLRAVEWRHFILREYSTASGR